MLTRRHFPRALLAVVALLPMLGAGAAYAQDALPKKTINLVVGFAPGGAIDTIARIVAQHLGQRLGQTVVVQNRPGAGGNIAQQQVYQAEPDGSTLLLGTIGSLVINPRLMKLNYNPRDMAPVSLAVSFPNTLVVKSDLGVRTLQEFIDLAKKDPKKVSFASGGVGTASHLAGEMFNQRAGVDILHVPYQGGAPALHALLGGQVTAYYATPSSAQPFLESKQVVALATTGLERTSEMPAVPTIAESGFKGFNATNWYAFVLPAKTPPALVKRWNAELVAVMATPEVIAAFATHKLVPKPSTPEELASFMESESASWAKVIADRNINLN
ncbi:Bug family tripartite tricarboxylate transporter substrate binding protein [Piscinibacter sakaiensis]|uniref:Bug family tripartite tricarboxylate transporter substrate binding protein n=1 Tax=Piscinibacter sakaiensis TaxID=1547922 RepID=UPI003AAF89C5